MSVNPKMELILAPLQGVTTVTYRQVYARHFPGLDGSVAPFISLGGGDHVHPRKLRDVLPESNRELPVVPQYLGNSAEGMLAVAHAVAELGYTQLNWNLGCPQKFIVKKRRGAGLLACSERIRAILEQAADQLPLQLSAKIRLGVDDPAQGLSAIDVLNDFPLTSVTIHARTAVQQYEGEVDHDAFAAAFARCSHPVFYNGDIFRVSDFETVAARFSSLAGVMLGRGVVRDPFLPTGIAGCEPLDGGEKTVRVRAFLDELYRAYCELLYGPVPVLGKMKELWCYQAMAFEEWKRIWRKVRRTRTLEEYVTTVDRLFESGLHWRL